MEWNRFWKVLEDAAKQNEKLKPAVDIVNTIKISSQGANLVVRGQITFDTLSKLIELIPQLSVEPLFTCTVVIDPLPVLFKNTVTFLQIATGRSVSSTVTTDKQEDEFPLWKAHPENPVRSGLATGHPEPDMPAHRTVRHAETLWLNRRLRHEILPAESTASAKREETPMAAAHR